jgi:2-keto-4-pentenoate hydratase/2-oxohepta-3-ene-1,7-dioic acid hydratase in catechol pathway
MMSLKLASVQGRAHFVIGSSADFRVVDVERSSNGALPSDVMSCYSVWESLRAHASSLAKTDGVACSIEQLDCPVPQPRQLFAVGLNYKKHAEEVGSPIPATPLTFAKFQSSINTPSGDVHLVGETCDYESELVIVIGTGGTNIVQADAWQHIAGITAGQDISDRTLQSSGVPPQFSLGKSRTGFTPMGPWVTDMHDNSSRDDLRLTCSVNGEIRQDTKTSDMIFDISQIVSYLSSVCHLFPGDAIFTGTAAGVGHGHKPPLYLQRGDIIETTLEGVGIIRNRCV